MGVVLLGGGVRSGKSRFALQYAESRFERLGFIATAQAGDAEMRERIARHQQERGPRWTTIEEPLDLAGVLRREATHFDVFVVDCLTLWLSNVMLHEQRDAAAEIRNLENHFQQQNGAAVVLITNEVGCGIVPDNALARQFRDLAGEMNQSLARLADEVYWMVFGVPMRVKNRCAVSREP